MPRIALRYQLFGDNPAPLLLLTGSQPGEENKGSLGEVTHTGVKWVTEVRKHTSRWQGGHCLSEGFTMESTNGEQVERTKVRVIHPAPSTYVC